MATNTIQQNNPILQSEFRYQRYIIEKSRSGRFWIFLAILLVAPAILTSLLYTVAVLFNLFPPIDIQTLQYSWHMNLLYLLIVSNVSMYAVVTLVTIGLSGSSIRREKDKHTWSLLRLTNISSNQIVAGKWWASLQALNGDHAMVILIRVGILAFALAIFIPSLHAPQDISVNYMLYFLMILPLIIVHGFLDAAFSAISGIAGAIPDDPWQSVSSISVLVIRLFTGIGVAWWFWTILAQLHSNIIGAIFTALYGIVATLLMIGITLAIASALVSRS